MTLQPLGWSFTCACLPCRSGQGGKAQASPRPQVLGEGEEPSAGNVSPLAIVLEAVSIYTEARLEAKMTQAELAENAHFRQSSISKIESGARAVTSEEVLYLSYALKKPILDFFPDEFRG